MVWRYDPDIREVQPFPFRSGKSAEKIDIRSLCRKARKRERANRFLLHEESVTIVTREIIPHLIGEPAKQPQRLADILFRNLRRDECIIFRIMPRVHFNADHPRPEAKRFHNLIIESIDIDAQKI